MTRPRPLTLSLHRVLLHLHILSLPLHVYSFERLTTHSPCTVAVSACPLQPALPPCRHQRPRRISLTHAFSGGITLLLSSGLALWPGPPPCKPPGEPHMTHRTFSRSEAGDKRGQRTAAASQEPRGRKEEKGTPRTPDKDIQTMLSLVWLRPQGVPQV